MSRKHAGPIMASSFVAGLLVTAAIFLPRVNEPIPEPFFGLDEPEAGMTQPRLVPGRGTETSVASQSARPGPRAAASLAALPARAAAASSVGHEDSAR